MHLGRRSESKGGGITKVEENDFESVRHLLKRLCAMVQNRRKHRINNHLIIHFPTSEGVMEVSASDASNAEQVNK